MRCPHCKETIDDDSLFCDQCGKELMFRPADQPLYLVCDGMKLELKEGSFGRKGGIYPEFSTCIYVSGRHGEFTRTPDGWTVLDYGSTNGTYLNGKRLKTGTPYPIRQGDSLKISRLAFIIQ